MVLKRYDLTLESLKVWNRIINYSFAIKEYNQPQYDMVKLILIQVAIIACLVSCSPPRFSFKPVKVTNDLIKLNGYYYSYWKENDELDVKVFFLYNSGVFYYGGGAHYKTLEEALTDLNNSVKNRFKINDKGHEPEVARGQWGIFKIDKDTSIYFEMPEATMGFPIIRERGIIQNDSTIKVYPYHKSIYHKSKIDSSGVLIWRFKESAFKPDSVNRFIKITGN